MIEIPAYETTSDQTELESENKPVFKPHLIL